MTAARVIADSVSPRGDRLTTLEVRMHRFVLAEFNTHRVFSRNSASSRAIPFKKQLERIENDPAIPVSFPAEQRGMQGGEEVEPRETVKRAWLMARDEAVGNAKFLHSMGVHKSVVNRILEPFMWHTVIVTATDWDGFWHQRISPLAQPEIRVAAEAMLEAYEASVPEKINYGWWHLPYIGEEDWDAAYAIAGDESSMEIIKKVSAARCARVSYLTHDGRRDIEKDIDLYQKLTSADPMHASPLEHVATPAHPATVALGNFTGWHQLRHGVEGG